MNIASAPKGKKEIIRAEEVPMMQFFKDGDHLRITAETITGGVEEFYLSKSCAAQIVKFIQANATTQKNPFAI
jgi:hypothetical protein